MPCYDPRDDEEELTNIYNENSKLESMLCSSCTALERLDYNFSENPRLDEWWDKHKRKDQERKRRQLLAAQEYDRAVELCESKTIAELTDDELDLLNKYKLLG